MFSHSVLGSAFGIAIGLLLVTYTLLSARRQVSQAAAAGASIAYRRPDWKGFAKSAAPLVAFIVVLHWLPDLFVWGYATFRGQTLVINERRWDFVLFVGHAIASIGLSTGLVGELWASSRKRHA
jgi:hypothetical protein